MKSIEMRTRLIGVIGGNSCTAEEYRLAEQVGALLATNNLGIVCGGMSGVMEAVCKGASHAGGITVGVLPGDDTSLANPFVQIPVATGMGIGRNVIIVRSSEALIAINGKYGTLSEIAYAVQLEKPVITVKPWLEVPGTLEADSPEEAVARILKLIHEK